MTLASMFLRITLAIS
ncbi:hypothetical protein E2C01_099487 [Portunus trituberculatus]|uniref:Uncharacterized protein n=1 Tax=Portunus trituberculatus TaxID=210409 RepID=A0A5B7K0H4_PORTR|nr:hypothetical protein [Portunus trituberculatus]